jgi:DNA polymerase III subunit gamma/tau
MALYHTHRPQTFGEITGQEHIVQTIVNQVKNQRVAHAYLFSGPRGVGKTTTARIIAKAVNCLERKDGADDICNTCNSCNEISDSRSIDVIEIDAASHTGVDNVRENIIENAQFKPTTLKNKVFIIDEVHMLSTSAFNALLKTLEEPPSHVIFILATTEKHKIPETIMSRCQRFDFKKIPYETMKKHLITVAKKEEIKIDKEVVNRIINKSDGCARDAISLLDQLMATGEKSITSDMAAVVLPTSNVNETLAFLGTLIKKDSAACFEQINTAVTDGVNLYQFAHDVVQLLRVMLVGKTNPQAPAMGVDFSDKVRKQLVNLQSEISNLQLVKLIDLFIKRRSEIKTAPIPQLPLELAVIEWCDGVNDESRIMNHESTEQRSDARPKETSQTKASSSDQAEETIIDTRIESNDSNVSMKQFQSKSGKPLAKNNQSPVSLDQAKQAWSKCIQKMETVSPSLVFILKMTKVTGVENNCINTEVQYAFHRDKLQERVCCDKIEDILSELLECTTTFDISVADSKKPTIKDNTEISELATAFGGEIVG